MGRVTEHPDIAIKIESFDIYDTRRNPEDAVSSAEPLMRIVYKRSDDDRRMTSFYSSNKDSLDVLYAILVAGVKHED